MAWTHRFAAALVAAALIANGGATAVAAGKKKAEAPPAAPACTDGSLVSIETSPYAPSKATTLRVLVTAETALDAELTLTAPDGTVAATTRERQGGPPYAWYAEIATPAVGTWQAKLSRSGASPECSTIVREITVRKSSAAAPQGGPKTVWPVRASWSRANENLYSAWIEKLFDAPADAAPSWPALHEVLRDRSRNFLFNHLGLREDEKQLVIKPDCADLPYFLRAYFAFKMGLPFGYAKCTRGGSGQAPRCAQWWNIENEEPPPAPPPGEELAEPAEAFFSIFGGPAPAKKKQPPAAVKFAQRPPGLVPGFGFYLRNTVANGVHSGSGRTAAEDNATDYYPIPLTEQALRPGTVYADPYGHLLVLSKRVSQTGDAAGVFFAVDGQPDGTVARKRFWRGNFLYALDPSLGSPGFKRFRPVMRSKSGLRRLTNAEIGENGEYGDFSADPSKLDVEAFYDRMDDVMSPAPLDPVRAIKEAITALEEQVNARVTSVENGRKFHDGGGAEVAMPDGASIFETTGAWEDFATPSRDLRLLIAIDVVRGFPERVARRPERYAMPKDKSAAEVKAELDALLASELAGRKFNYTRSDGSPWTLTLKDVAERAAGLEMAYNINDCVELRWGAADGSEEAATCKRRAPGTQREKMMSEYRPWFQERRRPPRG